MDRREAADLAETLDPDLVLPIHYDTFQFSKPTRTPSSWTWRTAASRSCSTSTDRRTRLRRPETADGLSVSQNNIEGFSRTPPTWNAP